MARTLAVGMGLPTTVLAQDPGAAAGMRAQTPVPPFPYTVEEVEVRSEVALACTVALPRRGPEGGAPGAVLLTVAGPNDRNQSHAGHEPYHVLADHLARNGVASIRCDDRGVGASEGTLTGATLDDLAADAMAMLAALASKPQVGPVGFIGNSEGSVVGSLAAAENPGDVSFVVLLGGVGVAGHEVIRERMRAQGRANGLGEEAITTALAPFDALVAAVLRAGGVGAERLQSDSPEDYASLREIAATAGANDPMLPRSVEERVALFSGPWYHSQLAVDGGALLARVEAPVLALTGSKDRTNLPDQNLPAIRAALEGAGHPDYTVEEVPDLNHVFQTANRGGMAEYAFLAESFAVVALERITGWIRERFPSPAR